jgi:hypothetical protein
MYIRQTDGRDRGKVIEMLDEEARIMVATGQAVAVDFQEPDPFGTRVDFDEMAREDSLPQLAALPAAVTDIVPPATIVSPIARAIAKKRLRRRS